MTSADPIVLIADDDRDTREMYAFVLNHAGVRVEQAETGEQALTLADRLVPDAIVTDLNLPGGMDGRALCQRLDQNPRTRKIPIILVTGFGDTGIVTQAARYVRRVLTKPCLPDDLRAAVQSVL